MSAERYIGAQSRAKRRRERRSQKNFYLVEGSFLNRSRLRGTNLQPISPKDAVACRSGRNLREELEGVL